MKATIVKNSVKGTRLDETYFRTSEIIPKVSDGAIYVYDGYGTRRSSWGAPSVSSRVLHNDDGFVAIDVTGWHKHSVSPEGGTYYFVEENGEWVQRRGNAKVVRAAKEKFGIA